jgi:hypothetical protein
MHLLLTEEEALLRNREEATKRGCEMSTIYWWAFDVLPNGVVALNVGDGEGLSEDELAMCVEELPND